MKSYPGSAAWWMRHTVRLTLQYKNLIGHIAYWHYSNMCGLDVLKPEVADLTEQELLEDLVENDCAFIFDEEQDAFYFTLHSTDGNDDWDFEASINELGCFIVGLEIIDAVDYDPNTGEVVEE